MSLAKLSVIVPTYNCPDLLNRAIQSVLDQTFQDFETVVVNDGMKERAKAVMNAFDDDRIRCIEHEGDRVLLWRETRFFEPLFLSEKI